LRTCGWRSWLRFANDLRDAWEGLRGEVTGTTVWNRATSGQGSRRKAQTRAMRGHISIVCEETSDVTDDTRRTRRLTPCTIDHTSDTRERISRRSGHTHRTMADNSDTRAHISGRRGHTSSLTVDRPLKRGFTGDMRGDCPHPTEVMIVVVYGLSSTLSGFAPSPRLSTP